MPAKYFFTDKKVQKQLKRLPQPIHIRALNSFRKIRDNPLIGEKLQGELKSYYKYRIGDYRIVYTFDSKKSIVTIVKIEHRQGVYK